MNTHRWAFIGLALALVSAQAQAQNDTCRMAGRQDVLEIENTESAGTRFAVRSGSAAASRSCDFGEADADYVVGSEAEPLWFAALAERYLLMSRSTGPQGDFVVYDLDERRVLLDAPADDFAWDDAGAVYWERVAEGTAANCPEFAEYESNGLGAAITAEKRFDFATGSVDATGRTRCAATQ